MVSRASDQTPVICSCSSIAHENLEKSSAGTSTASCGALLGNTISLISPPLSFQIA